jgi:hypothetical protein
LANRPLGPVPRLRTTVAASCIEIADCFGTSGAGLSISQDYSELLQGIDASYQHKTSPPG